MIGGILTQCVKKHLQQIEILIHDDIDIYTENITNKIIEFTNTCIPNKTVRIRPYEPPWMNSTIRRKIRIRKRAYRKAKQTNTEYHWNKFLQLRNKIILDISVAKQTC